RRARGSPTAPAGGGGHARGPVRAAPARTPIAAVAAERVAKYDEGNKVAAIRRAPTNMTEAPAPTRKRPTKRSAGLGATAMMMVPTLMVTPPAATTHRTPSRSSSTPAGIISPA